MVLKGLKICCQSRQVGNILRTVLPQTIDSNIADSNLICHEDERQYPVIPTLAGEVAVRVDSEAAPTDMLHVLSVRYHEFRFDFF